MDAHPQISVIISAYNRGNGLGETLRSVLAQDAAGIEYEVIAVDNNSTDDTADVIQSLIAAGHSRLRYVFERQQGVSYGRNAGIRRAQAPILAFTDDDVVVAPDWLRAIKGCFDENPSIDYVTGPMLPIYDEPPPVWLTRVNSGPCVLRDRGNQPLYSEPGRFFPGWATANIAFRRDVFARVGLFSGDFPRDRIWSSSSESGARGGVACTRPVSPSATGSRRSG
jgi:glycosyltransferase involved in cell wall biosynthesis